MTEFVDLYCERLHPGLWGEPLNAVTNLAFLLAAWRLRRQQAATPALAGADMAALPLLIASIGVASGLFHTLATRWAGALDSAFIALYLLAYVAVFAHRVGAMPWRLAWLAAPAFALFAAGVTAALGSLLEGRARGIGLYLAAWGGLFVLAGWAATRGSPAWRTLALAAAVFAISLTLRQLDAPWCADWPMGTHFAWHLLNALTLWLSARAVWASSAGAANSVPEVSQSRITPDRT